MTGHLKGDLDCTVLITGRLGFIGSALIRKVINETNLDVVNLDSMTYAGNFDSLAGVEKSEKYLHEKEDIRDADAIARVFEKHQPTWVMHLAAESHVDRSIDAPIDFIETNIRGTFNLLEASKKYFRNLDEAKKRRFRFHHVSTDEVYGDLAGTRPFFTELTPYSPSSPYSASKAASDHLVRAWGRSYDLPFTITNCSNNYGPYHFPEKLIPHVILNAIYGNPLPIYGDGS